MRNLTLVLITLFSSQAASFAQLPVFQDKSGETSIQVLNSNNVFLFNSGDASIGFQFAKTVKNARKNPIYRGNDTLKYFPQRQLGGNVRAKATEGIGKLLEDGKPKVGYDLSIFYQRAFSSKSSENGQFSTWYVSGKYSRSQFNLLESNTVNFHETLFHSIQYTAGITGYGITKLLSKEPEDGDEDLKSTYVYGISLGYGFFSNVDDLLSVERYTVVTTGSVPSSQTNVTSQIVVLKDRKKGSEGPYYSGHGIRINADLFLFPKKLFSGRVGIGGNVRVLKIPNYSTTNTSLGLILNMGGRVDRIALGGFYQFINVFSEANIDKSNALNLVAGYKF